MHYNFYFDETFHDKKITIKPEGVINVFTEDKYDNYLGVFWGYSNKKHSGITKRLYNLENKYIERYDIQKEFKSTTIKKINFKYGVCSLNKNAYDFY